MWVCLKVGVLPDQGFSFLLTLFLFRISVLSCFFTLPLVARGRRATLRGRRGTWSHWRSICVPGVALGDIYLRLAWQAWHWLWWRAWSPLVAGGAVALGDIDVPFAWQVWHLATSTCVWRGRRGTCCTWLALVARLVSVGGPGRRATLRGRCGTWWHWRSICVAGVALAHMNFRFAWQA